MKEHHLMATLFALFMLIIVAIIVSIYASIQYEKKHPCIRSHQEQVWQPLYTYANGTMTMSGGYWQTITICDERK